MPKLSRLQIKCDSPATSLHVSRDGKVLANHSWREPTPVNPGSYTVASVLDDSEQWKTQVMVPPQALTVLVTVPPPIGTANITKPVTVEPIPTPKTLVSSDTGSKEFEPQSATQGKTAHDSSGIWPTTALLVGAAGVVTGTMFALLFESKNGQARDIC